MAKGEGPCILLLSASAGAGHMVAARATAQALAAAAPDADVEVVDVLAISNGMFRRLYAGGYRGLVRYAPSAMGWLYNTMDRPGQRIYDGLRILIQDLNKLPMTRYVRQRRPDLIINTHYLPAEIGAQMRSNGQLDCPQLTICTDYETHRLWAQPPTERYYTATELGKAYLGTWGVPAADVRVTGIPVRAAFETVVERGVAREACGLAPDRPVVLLLCNGFSQGTAKELFHELLRLPAHVQIAAVCGYAGDLKERLERLAERAARAVRVVGFTDKMHEWLRAADLAVTKPGGLTVSEALAMELPMVIMNPIPGQETRNSDYLLERGAAVKVNNPRLLAYRVRELLTDERRMACLRAAAGRIARPRAARDIAADALGVLAGRS
jgi:processive 1,2-diacylglycerol beta-glucosyltransferase